jgi:hypothetical protein
VMVRAIPSVSFQIPVDYMLRVRHPPIDGSDRGELRTITSHTIQPL